MMWEFAVLTLRNRRNRGFYLPNTAVGWIFFILGVIFALASVFSKTKDASGKDKDNALSVILAVLAFICFFVMVLADTFLK